MAEANDNNDRELKKVPNDKELPFFAYGFFKSDELAYKKIENLVEGEIIRTVVEGLLYEKDGLPILTCPQIRKRRKTYKISGELISFKDGNVAYDSIASIEPGQLYCWETIDTLDADGNHQNANVLVACNDLLNRNNGVKGAILKEEEDKDSNDYGSISWHGYNDFLFSKGMDFLQKEYFDNEEYLNFKEPFVHNDDTYKKLFSLQMAYTFLWSIIDRHNSMRYNLNSYDLYKQRIAMAEDDLFGEAINEIGDNFIFSYSKIYASGSARSKYFTAKNNALTDDWRNILSKYSTDDLKNKLGVYFYIRCNVIHRGKSGHDLSDYSKLRGAFLDMFAIMHYMLSKEFNNKTKEVSCTDQNAFYGINKLKEYKRREEIAKSELKNSGLLKKGRKHGYNY